MVTCYGHSYEGAFVESRDVEEEEVGAAAEEEEFSSMAAANFLKQ